MTADKVTLQICPRPQGFDSFVEKVAQVVRTKDTKTIEDRAEILMSEVAQLTHIDPSEIRDFGYFFEGDDASVRFNGVNASGDMLTLKYDARTRIMFASVRVKRWNEPTDRKIKECTVMVAQKNGSGDPIRTMTIKIDNERATQANEVLVYELGKTVTTMCNRDQFKLDLPHNQRWLLKQIKGSTLESSVAELLNEIRSPEGEEKYNPDIF